MDALYRARIGPDVGSFCDIEKVCPNTGQPCGCVVTFRRLPKLDIAYPEGANAEMAKLQEVATHWGVCGAMTRGALPADVKPLPLLRKVTKTPAWRLVLIEAWFRIRMWMGVARRGYE